MYKLSIMSCISFSYKSSQLLCCLLLDTYLTGACYGGYPQYFYLFIWWYIIVSNFLTNYCLLENWMLYVTILWLFDSNYSCLRDYGYICCNLWMSLLVWKVRAKVFPSFDWEASWSWSPSTESSCCCCLFFGWGAGEGCYSPLTDWSAIRVLSRNQWI